MTAATKQLRALETRLRAEHARQTAGSKAAFEKVLTLNSEPSTLNTKPQTLNPKPPTLTPQPSTLNPKFQTLNPQTLTQNPKP